MTGAARPQGGAAGQAALEVAATTLPTTLQLLGVSHSAAALHWQRQQQQRRELHQALVHTAMQL
jgi:hypothetical protein